MKKRTLSVISSAVIAALSISTSFAQLNLGAECGCPAVNTRTSVNLSTLCDGNQEMTASVTLTCDKIWVIDQKIYVPKGKILTIQPGTVLKGATSSDPNNASALIIQRGGKIIADGTANCPIVMTGSNDPMDGTYSLTNVGDWGGLVLAGIARNTIVAANAKSAGVDGVGYMEGFKDNTYKTKWGAGSGDTDPDFQAFNDNDNSGILRHLSIRHAGALIGANTAGNELNGLSLYSVGRGTTIDYVETIAAADDNFEMFGGSVDLKHCSVLYGDDDFFDYDLGWNGRAQFLFGIAGDSITGLHTTDNGYEADSDDDKKAPKVRSMFSLPQIYNTTLVSNGHIKPWADNSGPAAIQAKELTGGTFINNVFVNFRSGLHLAQARSNSTYKGDAYENWTNDTTQNPSYYNAAGGAAFYHTLVVQNNTFIHCNQKDAVSPNGVSYFITKGTMTTSDSPNYTYKDATPASAADVAQFLADGNIAAQTLPGVDYKWAWNANHTDFSDSYHFTPLTNLTSTMTPPNDGFYTIVNYRGAFDATKDSWLSKSNGFTLPIVTSQNSNPTDLNNDGKTDIDDFSIFVAKFNQTNN